MAIVSKRSSSVDSTTGKSFLLKSLIIVHAYGDCILRTGNVTPQQPQLQSLRHVGITPAVRHHNGSGPPRSATAPSQVPSHQTSLLLQPPVVREQRDDRTVSSISTMTASSSKAASPAGGRLSDDALKERTLSQRQLKFLHMRCKDTDTCPTGGWCCMLANNFQIFDLRQQIWGPLNLASHMPSHQRTRNYEKALRSASRQKSGAWHFPLVIPPVLANGSLDGQSYYAPPMICEDAFLQLSGIVGPAADRQRKDDLTIELTDEFNFAPGCRPPNSWATLQQAIAAGKTPEQMATEKLHQKLASESARTPIKYNDARAFIRYVAEKFGDASPYSGKLFILYSAAVIADFMHHSIHRRSSHSRCSIRREVRALRFLSSNASHAVRER